MGDERGQSHLESKLAESVRNYIEAARSDDVSQEPEALRWMCRDLEWLLGERLQGLEGWEGSWVDGVIPATDMLPDAIQVPPQGMNSILGMQLGGLARFRMASTCDG